MDYQQFIQTVLLAVAGVVTTIGTGFGIVILAVSKRQAKTIEAQSKLASQKINIELEQKLSEIKTHEQTQATLTKLVELLSEVVQQNSKVASSVNANTTAVSANTASTDRTADGLAELVAQVQKMHSSVTQTLDMVKRLDSAGVAMLKQQFETQFAALEKTLITHIQARTIRETNENALPITGANGTGGAS